jgi:hypothetical protein
MKKQHSKFYSIFSSSAPSTSTTGKEPLKNKNLEMIKKLVSVLLSMFPSNAFCESVFSAVNSVWTDQRNSFLIETVNALISVKYNSEFECMEALDLFLSKPELLQQAKNNDKYTK